MSKPKPLDIASWAIKLLRYRDFKSEEEEEFFQAFRRAYRESAQHLAVLMEDKEQRQ
jgi:hypothetical protein